MVKVIKIGDLEKVLTKIKANAGKNATLQVGFMNGATEADGTPVALVAALNEYGHGKTPPRPFMRRTIEARKEAWKHNMGVALVRSDYDVERAFNMLGMGVQDDIKKGIRDLVDPPLAPYTIQKKGFDKPLIETGTMLNSVTYAVKGD